MESNGHIISKLKTTHTTQRIFFFFFENVIRESLYVYVWTHTHTYIYIYILRILSIFNIHTYGEKILKKLTVVYIQKGLTLEYTVQTLNLFNSHSFSNIGLTHYFFF